MLYCISANYTPKALQAMAKNPNTNREQLKGEMHLDWRAEGLACEIVLKM